MICCIEPCGILEQKNEHNDLIDGIPHIPPLSVTRRKGNGDRRLSLVVLGIPLLVL